MEVIKRGKRPEEIVWTGRCCQCDSVMQCKQAEIKDKIEYDQRESGSFAHWPCPVCGADFILYPQEERE
jgi:hypothetical protein